MTRERWFCCLCGAVTARDPGAARYALCAAHSNVPLDFLPPDPLTSLPTMADESLAALLVRFDAEIRLSEDEIEDVIGLAPLTYEACQQAVQNRIGHTGATVLDVTEYEERP